MVELLVVVAIIAILGAVSLPMYRTGLRSARISKTIQEIKVIGEDVDMYRFKNHLRLPTTLADIGHEGMRDPWATPYMYLNFDTGTGNAMDYAIANGFAAPGASTNPLLGVNMVKRKDKFLLPLNTHYDIYSMGEDGESRPSLVDAMSLDDIVRGKDGDFIGRATKY